MAHTFCQPTGVGWGDRAVCVSAEGCLGRGLLCTLQFRFGFVAFDEDQAPSFSPLGLLPRVPFSHHSPVTERWTLEAPFYDRASWNEISLSGCRPVGQFSRQILTLENIFIL